MTFKDMQLTITLRRLDPQFPAGSLPFGKPAQGFSAGVQNRKALTRMQFVELFGQTELCWRGHGATGFVTGYEVDVIHHTARTHTASVLAHAAAYTGLAGLGDAAT